LDKTPLSNFSNLNGSAYKILIQRPKTEIKKTNKRKNKKNG